VLEPKAKIPIFPLPDVVLFPGVALPLHVFEPRYRQMVRDAMASERPIVGIGLLKGDWQKDYYGNPQIFEVGCAGEIVQAVSLPQGRFNVLLKGLREYRIGQEIFEKSYRQAVVEWLPAGVPEQLLPREARVETARFVEAYLEEAQAVRRFVSDPSVSDEFFVNFFAFHLDLPPLEKQVLLEAGSVAERARRLCDVLDFRIAARRWMKDPAGPRAH